MVHKITPNNLEIRRVLINENSGGARLVNRYVSQSPLDRRAEDLGFIVPNLAARFWTAGGPQESQHLSLAGCEAPKVE